LKYFITQFIQVVEIKIMFLRNVMLYFGYITVGEQPSKYETKYMKQGAKPKKKRRAPDPPVSSVGKSTSDTRQLNPNVSETSRPITVS
jgi:hypothetical protein